MKFGPKLFLVLVGLILTLVVVVSWFAADQVRQTFGVNSLRAMAGAREMAEGTLLDRDRRSHLLLRPLVHDARIAPRLEMRKDVTAEEAARIKENRNDYFGSWMDEYWVEDREGLAEQDLMLLVGHDATLAYGLVKESKEYPLGDDALADPQIAKLLRSIPQDRESARMLWSGNRLRNNPTAEPGLKDGLGHGLYFAEASRILYHTPGTGSDELVGVAVVATHRLDLGRVTAVGVDALFADHGAVAESTFGLHDAGVERTARLEAAAMAWLSEKADGGTQAVELAGIPYYARTFEPGGDLTPGPVKAALFYSRESEFGTVADLRRSLAGLGVLLVLFAVAAAVVLSRGLSRPIAALSLAAGKVAAGDLKAGVPSGGKDELGDLARRFNEMVKGLREREIARSALGQYLSPEMAADLMAGSGQVSLQGLRRELTVLFCDVAGFTTISEGLQPEALVKMLNQYLDLMVKVLIKHGAYVDKFEGDAIMAFWNAPRNAADHAARACLAILQMRAAAVALSAEWTAAGMPAFTVRYGLHTGDAIVGNIGATDKLNYTAIGDNVNLASRLEGTNKQYGTQLLISETTRDAAREQIEVRELDVVKVKGKAKPVRIFELLAEKGGLKPEQAKARDRFEAGLKLYRDRRFAEALAIFQTDASDGPSRTFAERCARFTAEPPGPDWDGTFEMATK